MRRRTLAVLTALSVEPDKALYGMEIYDRTALLPGTTYPILRRSEHAGWVRSYWAEGDPTKPAQPRLRYYQITDLGVSAVRTSTARTADARGLALRWLGWVLRPTSWAATSNAVTK